MNTPLPLLKIDKLSVEFETRRGTVLALDTIDFHIEKGEIIAIVGESGSGKSVTAAAILGILDKAGRITQGEIHFAGMDLLHASESDMAEIRGREIAMIFQNPRAALNPIRSIGYQLQDILRIHGPLTKRDAYRSALEALKSVDITSPEHRFGQYPYELSGGMCQRVMIAMALSCRPALLIADEPSTGLDVTTQANIMDLIKTRSRELHMSTLLITHDLNMAAQYCDRIIVMHAGQVVESAPTTSLYFTPKHPYTRKLIAATPNAEGSLVDIQSIPGNLPNLISVKAGCRFIARCDIDEPRCREQHLPQVNVGDKHSVACWSFEHAAS